MKILRNRIALLGAALGMVLLLGTLLMKPGGEKPGPGRIPWAAAAGVLVVGVVALVARKQSSARQAGSERLSCPERLRLQPGKDLHLVEAEGRRLLISTSEQGVQLICELDRPSAAGGEETP